jgi:hypothetical protein
MPWYEVWVICDRVYVKRTIVKKISWVVVNVVLNFVNDLGNLCYRLSLIDLWSLVTYVLCFEITYGDIVGNLIGLGLSEIIYSDMLVYLLLF